jgi:uncharacterized membrane protein
VTVSALQWRVSMTRPPSQATDKRHQPPITLQSRRWNGPLPPPAILDQFEQVIPGSAERILQMAEKEQAHRLAREEKESAADIRDSSRGQTLGGIVALSAILGAVANSVLGGPWQASVALVGIPILGAVQAFIRGRDSSPQ